MIGQDAYELVENQHELAKIDLRVARRSVESSQSNTRESVRAAKQNSLSISNNRIATSVDIKIGETAISGTQNIAGSNLMTIADPSSILVEVEVDEADIANVRLNQDVDVYAVAFLTML